MSAQADRDTKGDIDEYMLVQLRTDGHSDRSARRALVAAGVVGHVASAAARRQRVHKSVSGIRAFGS